MRGNNEFDIRSFFRDTIGIERGEVLDLYERYARVLTLRKGEVYCRPGQESKNLRFLLNGISRGYVIGENGQETIICFDYQCGDALLGSSTVAGKPIIFMDAVTDMKVLEIPIRIVQQSLPMDLQLLPLYEAIVTCRHDKQTRIQIVLNTMSGSERYKWFCKEYKDIVNTVPQNYIASFLGIQPQSLSRIKKQMKVNVY